MQSYELGVKAASLSLGPSESWFPVALSMLNLSWSFREENGIIAQYTSNFLFTHNENCSEHKQCFTVWAVKVLCVFTQQCAHRALQPHKSTFK